jgi:hypothetical protein
LNKKFVNVTLLTILAFAVVIMPLGVYAQNLGVSILQITPSEASGPVGTSVNVQGTIYTSNGSYQVLFNRQVVASGKAEGFYVNANFSVPELPARAYSLILRDVNINVNSTGGQSFTITTGYAITASSATIQEGSTVSLTASVTGALTGIAYYAKINVALPNAVTTYTKTILLSAPNDKGTASGQVSFPNDSFQPAGSTTNYPGTYSYSFNSTLASNYFTVNILDQTSYHRGQIVSIRATGYEPNQAATISINSAKTGIIDNISVSASSEGIITSSYTVSSTAELGDYTVKITPSGTQKTIIDSQTYSVAGYAVKIQTTNLAGEVVPDISVQAIDSKINIAYTATSNSEGIADFKFERGQVGLTAFWDGINVGNANITVIGEGTFQLKCQLTNLKITIKNLAGATIPFVNLNIEYNYQSTITKTGSAQGQTGPSGSYTLKSALAGATYKVDASIYNQIFNQANNTFSNLPTQATVEVVIVCPSKNIILNVIGYNQEPIPYARIELVELSNGLFYSATTDNNGSAATEVTFGVYRARFFKDNALINEIESLQVFAPIEKQISATLYGIQIQVKVVDAIGRPISNAKVTLNGPQILSEITNGDGVAVFEGIIGGDMQIIAQSQNSPDIYQATALKVDRPSTMMIKMDKYIALGSLLLPSTFLVALIIVLFVTVTVVIAETLRRRRIR